MGHLRFALPSIVLVVLLFRLPLFQTMEATTYDLRLRVESAVRPIPESKEILILGIDDESLLNYGRWPWPRHYWADIIETLTELEARAVFLDVAFREPSESFVEPYPGGLTYEEMLRRIFGTARALSDAGTLQGRVPSGSAAELSTGASPVLSQAAAMFASNLDFLESGIRGFTPPPDALIGESLRLATLRRVLTAGICTVDDVSEPALVETARSRVVARRWLLEHPTADVEQLEGRLKRVLRKELPQLKLYRDLYRLLESRPNLNVAASGAAPRAAGPSEPSTGPTGGISPELARFARENTSLVRTRMIQDAAERALAAMGRTTVEVSPDELRSKEQLRPFLVLGRLTDNVVDQVLARKHLGTHAALEIRGLENVPQLPWGSSLGPPVLTIARSIDVVGADNEVKDQDGILRSTTLLWRSGERLVPAAAFGLYLELARTDRGSPPVPLAIEPGPTLVVRLPVGKGLYRPVTVPLSPSGQCLVHWAGRHRATFSRLPIGLVLTHAGVRREREEFFRMRFQSSEYALVLLCRDVARSLWLGEPETPLTLRRLVALVAARKPPFEVELGGLEGSRVSGFPATPDEPLKPRMWHRLFVAMQGSMEDSWLKATLHLLKRPASASARKSREKSAALARRCEQYTTELNLLGKTLSDAIRGRICFIGHVGSSSTDLAPMPFESLHPKIGSHANLLNTFLQERFIGRPPQLSWSLAGLVDPQFLQMPVLVLTSAAMALSLPALPSLTGAWLATVFTALWTLLSFALFIWLGLWLDLVSPVLATTITYVTVFTWRSRRTENIRSMFETYVDPQIVSVLVEDENLWNELGGREQVITAFFSDIAGFTTLSEQLDPQELSEMLTAYLSPMTDTILARGGTRDKYIGDAIVAFFGAPLPSDDHALKACLAAIEQQEQLVELKKKWRADQAQWYARLLAAGNDLSFRVGLNTGRAKVGNFGSKKSKNYTMIGDSVNLASRLEGANKDYGTLIMASEATIAAARQRIVVRELDRLVVKGKVEAVRVYEVLGRRGEVEARWSQLLEVYSEGLARYHGRRFQEARQLFARALEMRPGDGPSAVYHGRSEEFISSPPPDSWDGTHVMTHK